MQGAGERFYPQNIEGLTPWNIRPNFWEGRRPGLTAMVRLKDEAEWVIPSLDSVVDWCDEVGIFLQGTQTDGTDRLVKRWAAKHPGKAFVLEYPFDSLPNGPGHEKQPRGSVYERAYFYNWCQAHTSCTHVMKWDGDMVALDWLGGAIIKHMPRYDCIRFRGTEMVTADCKWTSVRDRTANEPRVWKVERKTWWYSGHKCEYFTYGHGDGYALRPHGYLHFKWAKAFESASKDWPLDWQNNEHFLRIIQRKHRGAPYTGPIPLVLRNRMEATNDLAS